MQSCGSCEPTHRPVKLFLRAACLFGWPVPQGGCEERLAERCPALPSPGVLHCSGADGLLLPCLPAAVADVADVDGAGPGHRLQPRLGQREVGGELHNPGDALHYVWWFSRSQMICTPTCREQLCLKGSPFSGVCFFCNAIYGYYDD